MKGELKEMQHDPDNRLPKTETFLSRIRNGILHGIGICIGIGGSYLLAVSITKPHTFTSGTTISSQQINANFDALYTKVNELDARVTELESGGKSWRLICEITITSTTTSFNTNTYGCILNGNTDVEYNIIVKIKSSAAGNSHLLIRPNNDTITGNYLMRGMFSDGGAPAADSANYGGLFVGFTNSLINIQQSYCFLYAKSGAIRILHTNQAGRASSSDLYIGVYASSWINTSSNITNLQFLSDASNGIGPDSVFEIWARR